jgi:hypothetical protein
MEMTLKWSLDGCCLFFVSGAIDRGQHLRTYSFPLAPGKMFPSLPPEGFRPEAEMAKVPGVKVYDVYDYGQAVQERTVQSR